MTKKYDWKEEKIKWALPELGKERKNDIKFSLY
jgi:hypothetical protein